MAPVAVPSGGLPLSEFPTETGIKRGRSKQAIEIASIGQETMEQIINNLRGNNGEAMVTLGKKPV
jgi:hypothetical protein